MNPKRDILSGDPAKAASPRRIYRPIAKKKGRQKMAILFLKLTLGLSACGGYRERTMPQ
jgi:hypothetical protein